MKIACFALAILLCGCSTTQRSNVANTFGYSTDSRVVEIGPYQIHYGSDGTSNMLLVAEGNHNLYSAEGPDSTIFVSGRSFVDYSDADGDGVVDKFMIHIRDKDGNDTVTLVDDDADGTPDHKIDHKAKVVYDWNKDQWVERKKQ